MTHQDARKYTQTWLHYFIMIMRTFQNLSTKFFHNFLIYILSISAKLIDRIKYCGGSTENDDISHIFKNKVIKIINNQSYG